jgi:predicted metal-binding membrane protein
MPNETSTHRSATVATGGGLPDLRRSLATTLVALLVLGSWAILWLWSESPYARYLGHDGWTDIGALAALCRALPQGDIVVPLSLHAGAWVLMIAAMMLPTTFPLLAVFSCITGSRPDASRLLALVILGFVAAWIAFGIAAHAADAALRAFAARQPWFVAHGPLVGAAVLATAGLFQWSKLKYRCLEACRSPFTFVMSHWHGISPSREALRTGVDHGIFCVGCCWALMLMMFVVGTGSIGWMLALAAVMAAEKNLPFGRRLRTPVGIALLGWAAAIVVTA